MRVLHVRKDAEMEIVLSAPEPEDAEALAAVHTESWSVGYRGLVPDAFLDSPKFAAGRVTQWEHILTSADSQQRVFVGRLDGRIEGFAVVGAERLNEGGPDRTSFSETTGELYSLYVRSSSWGSGLSDALMRASLAELRSRRFPRAVLWVFRNNPRARRFYERHGWSAGTGEEMVEELWFGPSIPGLQLPEPLPEVEYRIAL